MQQYSRVMIHLQLELMLQVTSRGCPLLKGSPARSKLLPWTTQQEEQLLLASPVRGSCQAMPEQASRYHHTMGVHVHLFTQLLQSSLLLRMQALEQAAHQLVAVLLLTALNRHSPNSLKWLPNPA